MRQDHLKLTNTTQKISIHAPLTGCDNGSEAFICVAQNFNPRTPYGMRLAIQWIFQGTTKFQSTHPLRDATSSFNRRVIIMDISIHAPLTGCDLTLRVTLLDVFNFNPRTPYGMRPRASAATITEMLFQSTHPLRDAT